MSSDIYEKFPIKIPIFAILISVLIYIIGAYIISFFGIIYAILYLIFCLGLEINIILKSCKYCYYFGKLCGLGKGKFASFIVKKGNPDIFSKKV